MNIPPGIYEVQYGISFENVSIETGRAETIRLRPGMKVLVEMEYKDHAQLLWYYCCIENKRHVWIRDSVLALSLFDRTDKLMFGILIARSR